MNPQIPASLHEYYKSRPDKFQSRSDSHKSVAACALSGLFAMLALSPSVLQLNNLAVRIAATLGAIYFYITARRAPRNWYGRNGGSQIEELAVKTFAPTGREPSGAPSHEQRILSLFAAAEWSRLASAPALAGGPLQLHIHHNPAGQELYLQVSRAPESPGGHPTGISEVKTIGGPDYELHYDTLKSMEP
jgi:hypothetical protein